MSGATKARRARLAKWAAEQGAGHCVLYLTRAAEELKDRSLGRRRSSDSASEIQARMAACRAFLRQYIQQGQQQEPGGTGNAR